MSISQDERAASVPRGGKLPARVVDDVMVAVDELAMTSPTGTKVNPRARSVSKMTGSASAVLSPLLWQRMMEPLLFLETTRSAISFADRSFQSRESTSH